MNTNSNVRGYQDHQLLNRIKTVPGYTHTPDEYFFIFVRSNEDEPDKFDDKVYLYDGKTFVDWTNCTTNSGVYGLKNFRRWNRHGAANLDFDRVYYDGWKDGIHRGKVKAWVQNTMVDVWRDNDMDSKAEEIGKLQTGFFGINIHTITYRWWSNVIRKLIGRWSVGCLVFNQSGVFRKWHQMITKRQKKITVFLLNEF